jgi:tetratricopeptide (TPR) repeat protein
VGGVGLLHRRTDRAKACHQRGWALSEAGRHAEALEEFRRALTLDPALTYVHYRIAFELFFLRRSAEALTAADAALAAAPDDTAAPILRGAVLFELGRYPRPSTR